MLEILRRGGCHLWYWSPRPELDDASLNAGRAFLDAAEEARYRRYLVREAADTLLGSRVLLRSVLPLYWDVKPRDWSFAVNEWGRPRIATPGVPEKLQFNLSHKPGFITCLVGYDRELGVDVEDISVRRPLLLQIASRFFSRAEMVGLRGTPRERQLDRFYELWTLKESYIKARGQGLSLGLSRFSFSVAGDSARVRFDEGFDDRPDRWDFRLFRGDASHLIATSIEVDAERKLEVEVRSASELICRTLGIGSSPAGEGCL